MKHDGCPYQGRPGVLIDHLEGVLPEGESQALTRHLAGCARCARELEGYAELLALARSGPPAVPPPGTEARLRAGIRRELADDVGHAGMRAASRASRIAWSWRRLVPRGRGLAVGLPAALALVLFVVMRGGHAPMPPAATTHTGSPPPLVATAPAGVEAGREATGAPGDETAPGVTGTRGPAEEAHEAGPQPGAAEHAEGGGHGPADGAAGTAIDPALEGELASYECEHLREYGTGDAAESLTDDETRAFTTLLDQELQALMQKYGNPGDQSNLGRPAEELS